MTAIRIVATLLVGIASMPAAAQQPVPPAADWISAVGFLAPGDRPCATERETLRAELAGSGILVELLLESLERCVHDNAVAMMAARERQAGR